MNYKMSTNTLFTVKIERDYKNPEKIEIYGPTNETYQIQKKIEINTVLDRAMMRDRKERLQKAKSDFDVKPYALTSLAAMYLDGRYVNQSYIRAFEHYEEVRVEDLIKKHQGS